VQLPLRSLPTRLAAGAYILHSGLEKWRAPAERAAALHGAASGAYPFLRPIPAALFVKLLSAGEIGLGATLLTPVIRDRVAGAALSVFSGSLLTMYLRTPAMHRPGSVWPTAAGTAVSKDVWMLGIGLGLIAGDLA